jgi:formate--tetrahydrofolate ligase
MMAGMTHSTEKTAVARPRPISEIAAQLGLDAADVRPYGHDVAKLPLSLLERPRPPGRGTNGGKLVLVSAITPTPAGEGKTTTSIGLAQGLARIGESACLALREPSLGPAFGMKGGATGGGRSQVIPMERINLHLTGDFHAITSAHNLLAALLDNHLYQRNALDIDPTRVLWRRVMDLNDRSLRQAVVGLGGTAHGLPRETGFDITAASEVMAMLCLAEGIEDLRARIDRTLVAFTRDGDPVTAGQLAATGAMLALLHDALEPNLVQTLEGTPALVHGGPFANIAHGCNSVLATRMALHLADWCITEAGFGFDLGAEKFFDIKCAGAGLETSAVVLVATVRALKMHGGRKLAELAEPDPGAVANGLPNLEKHVENIRTFGPLPVVALNRFGADTDEEIAAVERRCGELGVPFAICDHFARGGAAVRCDGPRPGQDLRGGLQDVRRSKRDPHEARGARSARGGAPRLCPPPGLHRQGARLPLGRSQAPRTSGRLRRHRARDSGQRRRGLPRGPDRRHHAHARVAQEAARRANRRGSGHGRDRGAHLAPRGTGDLCHGVQNWGMDIIATGSQAPGFALKDHLGREITLDQFRGKQHVLLLFYPLDWTPT